MKKILLAVALLVGMSFAGGAAQAQLSPQSDTTDVKLDINSTITIDCPTLVTMNSITGTGTSTIDPNNEATCNIKTNNSSGYTLTFTSSQAAMTALNGVDTIAAYTPATAGVTEDWSVAGADSEWGARLNLTASTDDDAQWGTDGGYAADSKWHNVTNAGSFIVVTRGTETAQAGSDEVIQFGAEVGASKFQPTGTYNSEVTFTATTNA